MSPRVVILVAFLIAVPIGYFGFTALHTHYLAPRRQIKANIATHEGSLALIRRERDDMPRVADELQAVVDRTLGPDLETVDHRLRSRLNRIGEDIGLANLSVSTGEEKAHLSPAVNDLPKSQQALRSELDFVELNGFISGDASYAQAVELIARLKAEPWIKRMYTVRLNPRQGGERFRVQVRLTTLFLPGRSPSQPLPEEAPPIDRARLAALTSSNPFSLPKPEAPSPAPPTVVAEAAPAASFPYDKWIITGVVTGPHGAEVWLLEAGSTNTALLAPGEKLSDMMLVGAQGDEAEFELDGRRIHLAVGQSLGEGVDKASARTTPIDEAARQ